MAYYQNGRHGTNSVEMEQLNDDFVDMDISAMKRQEEEEQQDSVGGFWSHPVATVRKNMRTIVGGTRKEEEDDDTKSTTSSRTSDEVVASTFADDAGNPEAPEDINRIGPLPTLRRNMNTLSDMGVTRFIIARALTVKSNIDFCQKRAESLTKDLGSLSTFSKNVDFIQAQTESMTQDVGSLETFSKNVDFAQNKAQSLSEDLASAPSKGGAALRSCLKRTSRNVSVRWKDGYNKNSNGYIGLDTAKIAPVKSSQPVKKIKKKTGSLMSSRRGRHTAGPVDNVYILAPKKPAINSQTNLQKAKLAAYERQVRQTEMMYRSIHAQRQRQSCPASA